MTFPDLENRLKTGPDSRLRVDGSALSTSVGSLFADFLSGRVIEFQKADAKPYKFKGGNQELDSVYVVGTLEARFLGVPSPHVEAWFFLINGDAEVVMTFPEMSDLSQSFQQLAERAAFSKCVFTLDSRRPNPLGDDFNALFSISSIPASKRGLRLSANLQVSMVDEALAQFGIQNLTVAGPVELADDMPRMRLATKDPVASFEFQSIALKLDYEYLTAPVLGHQKTRERLSTTLGYARENANLTIPLALTRDPDTLPESLIIESSAGLRPLLVTFDTLKGFLPGEIKAAIPADFPLNNLALTELSLEVGVDAQSISVQAVRARVEVKGEYPIVEYKKLITFADPGLEFTVTHYGDEWQVQPYIMGKLELAGGKLSGVVDLGAKSFFCVLDDDSHVDLKKLLEETLELRNVLPRWDRFDLTRFEICGDMEAKMFALDIGTTMDWPLDFGTTPINVKELFLSLEYADSSFTGALGGSLAIGGVTAGIVAKYDPAGWTFEMTAYNLDLTDLFASVLGDPQLADELPKVVFPNLELTVTPNTGAFRFNGQADVSWRSPFGMDGEFDCTIALTLGRQAATNAAVMCNMAFEGKGFVRVDGRQLSSTLNVVGNKDGPNQLILTARGTLLVGGAQFIFEIASGKDGKELSATWEHKDSEKPLNLKDISEELPDLPGLEALIPKRAHLKVNFTEKRLSLDCEYVDGAKAAFLLQHDSVADTTIVALGLTPGKPISTKNLSLGALGSALEPYSIALDDLVVVAANANAPEGLKLPPDWKDPFTKGLLLGGVMKFEGTSFSYPFECRLGSEKPESRSLPEEPPADEAPKEVDEAPKEVEQGKNNVAVGRTIGPITFRKARLESRDSRVYVLLDASLGSGGFDLDLTGFNLNFPLAKLTKPSELVGEIKVGLDGLSIAYSKPPLTISGGFAKTVSEKSYVGDVYSGHVLIKAAAFQITVLGKYGTIKAEKPETEAAIVGDPTAVDSKLVPSLFLYGMYDGVVGGPAAFFVTGLALGGGYNTRLAIPTLEKVADFPLVQAAASPGKKLTSEALDKTVLPSYGDYWLAVGVKFNSFKMADSFALFSVSFGSRLQFALLGFTKLIVPTGAVEGKCAVYAELAIRAVLDPAAGVFSIEGQLTENSYVFGKEFRLTGGFAFFVWFGNAKEAGDFVISLGGYHPDFLPPLHYPVVPRVGISAKLSDALSITGEAYLALTPSCLMAGLKLAAVFETGSLKAAFVAYADFLIAWAPFHYDASIGIGIAVIFWRFKLELSASLHVWGPPFAGTARVSLWIVSFTVEFGSRSREKPNPLKWPEFQEAFLPARVSTIRITEGLVREVKTAKKTYRIVNSHELMIETDSAVPCSEVRLGTEKRGGKAKIGITPMEATNLISTHVVSIKAKGGTAVDEKFRPVEWSQKNYPEALWSASKASGELESKMVKDVPSGLVLRVKPTTPEHRLGPFPIEKFKYEPISWNIRWSQSAPRPKAIDEQFPKDPEKILPLLRQIRDCLPNPVSKSGRSRWNEIAMDKTFAHPNEFFQELPTCAALGQSLSGH